MLYAVLTNNNRKYNYEKIQKLLCIGIIFFNCLFQLHAAIAPTFYGKLVFHRYSDYEAWDSKLYLYNFTTQQTTLLGANWKIDHMMNGHFSPDGKWLTFMGVNSGQHYGDAWDVYVWKVGSTELPINLTQGNNKRDEDPKFIDNQRIIFKQNGDLKIIKMTDRTMTSVTQNGWDIEESMPYPMVNTTQILYAKGAGNNSRIFSIDQSGAYDTQLTNIASYYPVWWQGSRFLYVCWYSPTNPHDQIYIYDMANKQTTRLPFNNTNYDTSDPAPLDQRYMVVSLAGQTGSRGGYDLYIADSLSSSVWPLPINTNLNELGAFYTPY
ncbi:hypothetical protein NCW36_18405 [Acinetobacter pittii]|nr:hypothetical protein [Acinetobacter pittii]